MISKFNPRYHANLKTPNNRLPSFRHRKAKQWYAELLGFPPYFDEPFYIGFNVKGFELGLQPKEGAVKTKSEGVNTGALKTLKPLSKN